MNIFKNLKFNRLSFKNLQVVLNIQQLGLEFLSLNQCGCKGYTASSWLSASTDDCCPAFPAVVSKCEESTNPWASSLRKARNCPQLQSFQRQRNFSHLGKGGGEVCGDSTVLATLESCAIFRSLRFNIQTN